MTNVTDKVRTAETEKKKRQISKSNNIRTIQTKINNKINKVVTKIATT